MNSHASFSKMDAAELTALLGSRLCHDLISPLGAIANGVELIQMTDAFSDLSDSPEMQLISQSVTAAQARIRVFRLAFGMARHSHNIDSLKTTAILRDIQIFSRLQIEADLPDNLSHAEMKMILLALMCLESAMPWGGRARIDHSLGQCVIAAECDRVKQDHVLWAWLNTQPPALDRDIQPSEVHFPLLAVMASSISRPLSWDLTATGGEIRF